MSGAAPREAAMDRAAAAKAIGDLLRALGRDPAREPDLAGTPERVAAAWIDELLDGYAVDPVRLLRDESSDAPSGGVVVLRDVGVATVCPHHLLPARGRADVAYEPRGRVPGLGTVVRVVAAHAHRLTLQEHIGEAVVRSLREGLGAERAACRIVLQHECLASRGERETAARVETLAFEGFTLGEAALLFGAGA